MYTFAKLHKALGKFTDGEGTRCSVGKQIETLKSQMSDLVAHFSNYLTVTLGHSPCLPLMNLMELSLLFQLYKLLRNTGTEKAIS